MNADVVIALLCLMVIERKPAADDRVIDGPTYSADTNAEYARCPE